MGPKKASLLEVTGAAGQADTQRALTLDEIKSSGSEAFGVVADVLTDIWSKYDNIMAAKRLDQLLTPYMAETGISVSLEPSTMLFYACDRISFDLDRVSDQEEPERPDLDQHCLDRY